MIAPITGNEPSKRMIAALLKLAIPSLLCVLSYPLFSQTTQLPSLQHLTESLTKYTHLERDARLKAFDSKSNKGKLTQVLPSFGVMYNLQGQPRPSASWSPLQILDRRDRKRKTKLDRESIILSYELILTDRIYKLQQLYHDYRIDQEAFKINQESLAIDEKLFEISQAKYDKAIIKPSDYLKEKKSILISRAALKAVEMDLMKKRNQIIYEAKWN